MQLFGLITQVAHKVVSHLEQIFPPLKSPSMQVKQLPLKSQVLQLAWQYKSQVVEVPIQVAHTVLSQS